MWCGRLVSFGTLAAQARGSQPRGAGHWWNINSGSQRLSCMRPRDLSSSSFESADEFIQGIEDVKPEIDLGLQVSKELLQALGNPQNQLKVVHVAGTNGKGSVCSLIASGLRCSGLKVGVFNSPHLLHFSDAVLVDGKSDFQAWVKAINQVQQTVGGLRGAAGKLTAFEALTAGMWVQLLESKVDIAVIETGVGGRLDATNVCEKIEAAVITPIGLDHQGLLGDTILEISRTKAGILKSQCPVIVPDTLHPDALRVVGEESEEIGAMPFVLAPAASVDANGLTEWGIEKLKYRLSLNGRFQLVNSGLAAATLKTLGSRGWDIQNDAIVEGFESATWPGRLEWEQVRGVSEADGLRILLDGAHNPQAAEALRDFVDSARRPGAERVNWVIGMLEGKDLDQVLRILVKEGDSLFAVPVVAKAKRHSAIPTSKIIEAAKGLGLRDVLECPDLSSALRAVQGTNGLAVLCGSLHLVADFKHLNSKA